MIENYDAWGTLVQKWALGNDPQYPLPRDLTDIKNQCSKMAEKMGLSAPGERWRAVINLPATMTGLAILQNSQEVLAIRLPAKKAVEDVLARMGDGQHGNEAYPLPEFYSEQFAGHPRLRFRDQEDKKRFLTKRIGDYSVSNCG
jgi:hypothetical protein